MVGDVGVDVVSEEDVVEEDMAITHMNLKGGTEHSCQNLVYNLHNNGDSSHRNKIIIFKK